MMLGELLTYKDANLAVHLIGERFKFSNVLSETGTEMGFPALYSMSF